MADFSFNITDDSEIEAIPIPFEPDTAELSLIVIWRNRDDRLDKKIDAYKKRIQELRELGEEEEIAIRPGSEKDFLSFVQSNPGLKEGILFLLDGGSLSALWASKSKYRVAIRFFGRDRVQFTFIIDQQPEKPLVASDTCSIKELNVELKQLGFLFE